MIMHIIFLLFLPFFPHDVLTAINNLLQTTTAIDGDTVVILRRRITQVCGPRGRALSGPSGDRCRYVRVGTGPHLDSSDTSAQNDYHVAI